MRSILGRGGVEELGGTEKFLDKKNERDRRRESEKRTEKEFFDPSISKRENLFPDAWMTS